MSYRLWYYIIGQYNYVTDNWFIIELPMGALRVGTNDILLWADTDSTNWQVKIATEEEYRRGSTTRIHHPNRSAKSTNGGRTWDDRHLGWKNEIDGEYAIRVSLDRFVSKGTYVSPVIDLADTSESGIKKLLAVTRSTLIWDIEQPEGTSASVSLRTGPSPVIGTEWSDFTTAVGFKTILSNPKGRYLLNGSCE